MKKEPFLQVSKRRNKARWQERLLIRFIALILALIVCGAVIVALVKMNPVENEILEHRCRRSDPDRWCLLCCRHDLCRR